MTTILLIGLAFADIALLIFAIFVEIPQVFEIWDFAPLVSIISAIILFGLIFVMIATLIFIITCIL